MLKIISALALFALVAFAVPRGLEALFTKNSPWIPILYQYLMGGFIFTSGVVLILYRKSCVPGRGNDTLWLGMLVAGLACYFTVHLVWTILAVTT